MFHRTERQLDVVDMGMEFYGRKVDIARYVRGFDSIVPVGAVTQIRYSPKREQQQRQGESKEHPFQMMFQMQLKEAPMEENQSFQLYC